MKGMSIRIFAFAFTVASVASAQNFQQRIADIDEKAVELQRRLRENEIRLQRHAEIMEQAQVRLKALQAGESLPPRVKIPAAPPEPTPKTVPPTPIAPTPAPQPRPIPVPASIETRGSTIYTPSHHKARHEPRDYYFQIFSGVVVPGKVNIPKDGSVTRNPKADYDNGYSIGAGAGIDFGNWRLGLELSHRSYDDSQSDWGHAEVNALLANVGWELDYWESNVFYLGLGLGPSLAKIQRASGKWSYRDTLLAYQIATGLGHRFTEGLSGRLGYKYFSTANGDGFERLYSHGVEAVLEFDL